MTERTRFKVRGLTRCPPLMTRETVVVPTPALRATSASVACEPDLLIVNLMQVYGFFQVCTSIHAVSDAVNVLELLAGGFDKEKIFVSPSPNGNTLSAIPSLPAEASRRGNGSLMGSAERQNVP